MVVSVPTLRLTGISKTARPKGSLIHDVSLNVAAGESLTLLGPSESGKTALLMLAAGIETPDAGSIEVDGAALGEIAPRTGVIGLVAQRRAVFPNMTLAENVALPLVLARVPIGERRRRVAAMLDLLGLGPYLDRPVARMPDALRFRVALAQASIAVPKVLLVDEPFAGLAADDRETTIAALRRLQRQMHVAILLATREPAAAFAASDRVAVLLAGRIGQIDRPQRLYDRPATAAVARTTGEDNQLRGRIVDIDGEVARVRLSTGNDVEAETDQVIAVGSPCVVSVRPERIAVAAVSAAEFGQDAVAAQVVEAAYLGDHWRLHLSLVPEPGCEAARLLVKRPASASAGGFAPGRPVAVGWQAVHARVFRDEE